METTPAAAVLAKILWEYNTLFQQPRKSDCILVLGSNDLRVAQRGIDLFQRGFAPFIIFSGGYGEQTRYAFPKPEAAVFADIAVKSGIPRDRILIEKQSRNTLENIRRTRAMLEQQRLSLQSAIIVHKPHSLRRTAAILRKQWPEIEPILTGPELTFEEYPNTKIPRDTLYHLIVGDTHRIMVYPERGLAEPQPIPPDVATAFAELVRRGYTRFLVQDE